MNRFFAESRTIDKLYHAFKLKVLLIGGYDGYWNFGDLMQPQGTARFYRSFLEESDCAIFHIQGLDALKTTEDLERFKKSFIFNDIIYYEDDNNSDYAREAKNFGLMPVDAFYNQGYTILHVYGGGFLNQWWGTRRLNAIESALKVFQVDYYLFSGQQIGPEFAGTFAEHCKVYQPDLIGCRDPLSVEYIRRQNLAAVLSGDDALEELGLIKLNSSSENSNKDSANRIPTFGINLNLTGCVISTKLNESAQRQQELLKALDNDLQMLFSRFGASTCPLVIEAAMDRNPDVDNNIAIIKKSGFSAYFPKFDFISLPGLFIQNNLNQRVGSIRECQFVITNSYHLTLFCKVLEVPVYLIAFNDYYRQKKQGLEERTISLSEFMQIDRNIIIQEQRDYILKQKEIRVRWLDSLRQAIAESMQNYHSRQDRASSLQSPDKNLVLLENPHSNIVSQQLNEERSEMWVMAEEIKSLKQQLWVVSNEQASLRIKTSEQERQLNDIIQSRSWKLVQKYRKLMSSPIVEKLLRPFERVAIKILWR
jgi:hypothetical protein